MNSSKRNDPRFWKKWKGSGAIRGKVSQKVEVSEELIMLGSKAFALAIHEHLFWLRPKDADVEFEPGFLYHRCIWEGEGVKVYGNFFHRELQPWNQGSVCITMVSGAGVCFDGFPHSWHHLFSIGQDYLDMHFLPIEPADYGACFNYQMRA